MVSGIATTLAAGCPAMPPFLGVDALPDIPHHPDPFVNMDGSRVDPSAGALSSEWRCRREEIAQQLQHSLAFGNHQHLKGQLSHRAVQSLGDVAGQVAQPHDSGHLFGVAVMDRQPAVPGPDRDVEGPAGGRGGAH